VASSSMSRRVAQGPTGRRSQQKPHWQQHGPLQFVALQLGVDCTGPTAAGERAPASPIVGGSGGRLPWVSFG
jgi:hypothetical protein